MQTKRINMGVLLVLLLLTMTTVNAAPTEKPIANIRQVPYQVTSNLTGDAVYSEKIEGTNKLLKVTTNEEIIKTDYEYIDEWKYDSKTDTGYYYFIDNNYTLNYSEDGKNYTKKDLKSIVKSLYNVTIDKDNRLTIKEILVKDDTFYVYGVIEKVIITKHTSGTFEYTEQSLASQAILFSTKNLSSFTKSNLPAYECDDYNITDYEDNYIIGGEYNVEENKKYVYYTSKDLNSWTKRELDLSVFKQPADGDYKYVKLRGATKYGIVFVNDYKYDYNYYPWHSYKNEKSVITSDFTTYKLIDETAVTAPSSSYYCYYYDEDYGYGSEEDKKGFMEWCEEQDWEKEVSLYKYASNLSKGSYPTYGLEIAYKGVSGPIGSLRTKGLDIYITNPYGNKYEHYFGTTEDHDTWYYIYSWLDDEKNYKAPINFFTTYKGKTTLYHFDDHRSKEHKDYLLNLDVDKFDDYASLYTEDYVYRIAILYNERFVIFTDMNFNKVTKMRLPEAAKSIYFSEDKTSLNVVTDKHTYSMKLSDIDSSQEVKVKLGELTNSGKTELSDVLVSLKMFFGNIKNPTDEQSIAMDMNEDGKTDLTDILLVLKKYFNEKK